MPRAGVSSRSRRCDDFGGALLQHGAWVGEGAGMGCPAGMNLSPVCSKRGDSVTMLTGGGRLWVRSAERGREKSGEE